MNGRIIERIWLNTWSQVNRFQFVGWKQCSTNYNWAVGEKLTVDNWWINCAAWQVNHLEVEQCNELITSDDEEWSPCGCADTWMQSETEFTGINAWLSETRPVSYRRNAYTGRNVRARRTFRHHARLPDRRVEPAVHLSTASDSYLADTW